MTKVGFIDYYLDEFHANNYPKLLNEHSGGRYEVCCAYGRIDSPKGGETNKEWSEKHGIPLAASIDEVVEKSDVLIVLSPDNPEMHEELCDIPLRSGKLVYVDKTFAPDKAAAERLFEKADANGTKCFSSSALRFASELTDIDKTEIDKIYSEGPCDLYTYLIHQAEPIVMLMDCKAKRVMFTGCEKHPALIIEFEDGRHADLYFRNDASWSFKLTTVNERNGAKQHEIKSDFFGLFIDGVIDFFDTGIEPVSHQQTLDVMGIIGAAAAASKEPYKWFEI